MAKDKQNNHASEEVTPDAVSSYEEEAAKEMAETPAHTNPEPVAPAPAPVAAPASTRDSLKSLEEKVRLKIGVIGIGNAGSQIVAAAHKAGFRAFIINSSLKDLSDSVINDAIPSYIVGNEARGAGKNRAKAKELLKVNGKQIFGIQQFSDLIEESDVVFVCTSTAGGTGSGISPQLIHLLTQMYEHKIFISYSIIPKLSDSVIAQNNTLQFLNEIEMLKIPYMIADLAFYEDNPNDVAYAEIAKHMVKSIEVISGKFLNHSNNGMIDENDMRVIIGEPGYMAAYFVDNITPQMVDSKSIQSYIIGKIKNSPAARIQQDKIVKQMGVIVNCPDSIMESTKSGNYNEICDYVGVPLAIFENYSITEMATGQFIVLISGMNLPYSRILQAKNRIEQHEEALRRVKPIDLSGDVSRFAFLDERDTSKLVDTSQAPVDEAKKHSVLNDYFG